MIMGNVEHKCTNCVYWGSSINMIFDHCTLHEGSYGSDDCCDNFTKKEDNMTELIDRLSKTCENCKFRGTLSFNYPCCDCLEPERDHQGSFDGNLTGCIVFTKFCPIDATCIPKQYVSKKDKIRRYLDKLKENGLITDYDTCTVYMDDKPHSIDISLYSGKYAYKRMFSCPYDEKLVIDILAVGLIHLYREMADDLMEKIKEDKE